MVEIIILVPVKTFWFPEAKFLTKRILKPPSILDYYIVRTSLGPVSWLVYPSQTLIVWNNKNLFRRIMFNFLTYCILNNWFNWRPWACFKLLIFLHAGLCLYAGRWECPWHDCSVCGAPASSLCDFCPRSFCRDHEAGALIPSSLEGRLCCSSHNPGSPLGSSSGSTQPHCSALSPVRVKEEPEIESGLSATEWHRSAAQYLILWKVRSHWPPGFWSTSDPKQRTTKGNTVLFFLISVVAPIFRDETHWRTPQCRSWWEQHDQSVGRGSVLTALAPFFLLSCHDTTTNKALYSSPVPIQRSQTPT